MVYAGDLWVQLPTRDLYDSQMMAIAINAAKDMYEKRQLEMKDFSLTYGDFMTPITKDQEYYNNNIIKPVKDVVNAIYAAGGDPLRDPNAHMMISRTIANLPTYDMPTLKQSAKNYERWLENKQKLLLSGLYNPRFDDAPDINDYSTLGPNGRGIWNAESPTPIRDMAEFTKPYYDSLKPHIISESRDGVLYLRSIISLDDLKNVAENNFENMLNTQQGKVMYDTFLKETGDPDQARQMLINEAINANLKKLQDDSNYDDTKHQELLLRREANNIARIRANAAALKTDPANNIGLTGRLKMDLIDSGKRNLNSVVSLYEAIHGRSVNGAKELLISEGIKKPTQKLINERISRNKRIFSPGLMNKELFAKNYEAYTTDVQGEDRNTMYLLFIGNSLYKDKSRVNNNDQPVITFTNKGHYSLTAKRHAAYAGLNLTKGSISEKLNAYLIKHHIEGTPVSSDITVSRMPIGGGKGIWDINGYVRVKKSDLDAFVPENVEDKDKDAWLNSALSKAGAILKSQLVKGVGIRGKIKNALIPEYEDYVDLPVSKTIDTRTMTDAQINTFHDERLSKVLGMKHEIGYIKDAYDESNQ